MKAGARSSAPIVTLSSSPTVGPYPVKLISFIDDTEHMPSHQFLNAFVLFMSMCTSMYVKMHVLNHTCMMHCHHHVGTCASVNLSQEILSVVLPTLVVHMFPLLFPRILPRVLNGRAKVSPKGGEVAGVGLGGSSTQLCEQREPVGATQSPPVPTREREKEIEIEIENRESERE